MDLPEARSFLTGLFNDMMKIIETVDINLAKPRYSDSRQQFLASWSFVCWPGSFRPDLGSNTAALR